MENASKALLMAGSVLLGIIVLSLFMVMLNSLTDYQQSQTQSQREKQLITFNNQFNGYMRDDISGADILSLINKVVFYNRTRSVEGTEDEGVEYGYQPITLIINFNNQQTIFTKAADGKNKLFTENLEFSGTQKTSINNSIDKIDNLKNATLPQSPSGNEYYYTEGILQTLLDNYSNGKIFVDDNIFKNYSYKDKLKLFADFNTALGKYYFPLTQESGINKGKAQKEDTLNNWFKDYFSIKADKKTSTGNTIKEDLDLYYEYTQFKRAIFKWNPENGKDIYNANSGRIVYMKFDFTGNFI